MSEFCRDCSIATFGSDFREFAQLLPPEAYCNEKGKEMGALVLCECCGPVVVDINGRRIDGQEFLESCSCQMMGARHGEMTKDERKNIECKET